MFLLGNNYQNWESKALSGKYPIPVCTSAFKDNTKEGLQIADYTPFEIGSTFTRTYYSANDYHIKNYDTSLPPAFGDFMVLNSSLSIFYLRLMKLQGIWGSAFYTNIRQVIPDLPTFVEKTIGYVSLPGVFSKSQSIFLFIRCANQQHKL